MSTPTSPDFRALCAEQLPELRGMFERILCIARSSDAPAIGNIQLADRLIAAVVSWSETCLSQSEPVAPTDEQTFELADNLGIIRGHGGNLHVSLLDLTPFAESVLTRWGTPTIEPLPVPQQEAGQ
jgi:hypothetical protein